VIVTTFPRTVRVIEHTLIPLKDGTTLAARIWLPDDAEQNPVPAILEYLPYRKRDGTYERDALTHPYLAGHGYAGVRVDIRGCGESNGLLFDEYAKQEQDDGLEVIAWLAAQPWCCGVVGMMGISWGGFNGLQIAARRPPALKAIVNICSTDDRYADDVHYMGGTLLAADGLEWGSFFFGSMCLPPDPMLVGDRWRGWSAWRTYRCSSNFGCSTNDVMRIGSMDRYARITRRSNVPSTPSAVGPMPIRMQFHAFSSD
jgi:predicted acyl esterase